MNELNGTILAKWVDAALNDLDIISLTDWDKYRLAQYFGNRLEKYLGESQRRPLEVGDIVHGFAYGIFGRDHFKCVRVEAVGADWAVTRNADSEVEFIRNIQDFAFAIRARDERCVNLPFGCLEEEL
ncbi:hypothetical protein GCM10010149_88230 [Nonomuraea roseoviolacea subsp. roseoviolacea]|uniref:hypothetical protein n=1 Tax=Nonomuraea roseoviolacea TaxID=103837 RepID=UPI0031D69D0E